MFLNQEADNRVGFTSYAQHDRWLLFITLLLIVFGAFMLYSSTSVITPVLAKRGVTDEFYYFKRHLCIIFIGLGCMFLFCRVKPVYLKKMAIPFLVFSFLLLILVFLPGIGVSAKGAQRWIGLWPSTFQPSELVKLSMVMFLAKYLSAPGDRESFIFFIKPVFVMILFQAVILKQPDFGAAMSLVFLTFAILFLSGIKLRYLFSVSLLALPLLYKLIMEPYRLKRILSFLDPWKDPLGDGFQLVQSFIALGSGGITGVGIASSKQKLSYLPESHTDFIFSIIGEEFGLIGVTIILALFLLLFIRGISIANRARERFAYYLAMGLSLMISIQALTNFAVASGMVPTKGLPLPFISYGGSSLLVNSAAIGMLLNISKSKGEETTALLKERKMIIKRKARRNIEKGKRRGRDAGALRLHRVSHSQIYVLR